MSYRRGSRPRTIVSEDEVGDDRLATFAGALPKASVPSLRSHTAYLCRGAVRRRAVYSNSKGLAPRRAVEHNPTLIG